MVGIASVLSALAGAVLVEALTPNQHSNFLGVGYDPKEATDSTANPHACKAIYIIMMSGCIIWVLGEYVLDNRRVYLFGLLLQFFGATVAAGYAAYHGLVSAWWETGHNLTDHCKGLAGAALVMYPILFCCCACGSAFAVKQGLGVVKKMKEATEKRRLSDAEKDYLNSKEFLAKCNDMFLEADKDGNGVLDIKELKQFVLKELPQEQQGRLQEDELFKEAFDNWDDNQSGTIDQEEFVEVMKYCRAAHARSMAFVELFGDKILTKEGAKHTTEVLASKTHVMVYFSAHWCPPCRGYTPDLSAAYENSSKAGKEVAVIFVSSDRDQAGFDDYWGSMTFDALPYSNRDAHKKLNEKFGVKGIPTLTLLDGEGNLVDGNIRGKHGEYL